MSTHEHDKSSWVVGVVTVLLALAGWTVVPIFIKMFTRDVDPWTSNGWRYAFAALLWAPLLLFKWRKGVWKPGLWRAALIPGVINGLAQVCFTLAFYQIDPGLVTFGLRAQILAVTLGAALMFPGERAVIRTPLFLVGLLVLVFGILTTVTQSDDFASRGGVLGVMLAVGAGVGYAGYALSVRSCMKGYGAMESFAAISQYTAGAMVVLMLLLGDEMGATALRMAPDRFGLFLLSSVIGIAAGHVLYYIAIAKLGVTVSSGVIQLQPFTVSALSFFVFGEVLSAVQWTGGALAVAGAVMMLVVQHVVQRRIRAESAAEGFGELPPDPVVAAVAVEETAACCARPD